MFLQGGKTALHLTAENGHEKVVELLLAAGAEVNKIDEVSDDYVDLLCLNQ